MIKYFLSLIIVTLTIQGTSRQELPDRKKSFDNRAKLVLGLQNALPSDKLAEDAGKLKNIVSDLEAGYKTGDKEKAQKALSLGEPTLTLFQKDYITFFTSELKGLMEIYSAKSTEMEKKEDKKVRPNFKDVAVKEKTSQYFSQAKTEFANGAKYERDRNLQYSLILYKRSMHYTILAFQKSKFDLPEKFSGIEKELTGKTTAATVKKEKDPEP